MTRAEAEWLTQLLESVVDGQCTAQEVSDELEISVAVIERVAQRMREQRRGVPPAPPDDMLDYCVPLVYG